MKPMLHMAFHRTSLDLKNLYNEVLHEEKERYRLKDIQITRAIRVMNVAYSDNLQWHVRVLPQSITADFNKPEFRCAYIHKYAMCYTGMMHYFFGMAIYNINDSDDPEFTFRRFLCFLRNKPYVKRRYFTSERTLNICSLGGGPGTDIVGILSAIDDTFSLDVSVIDYFKEWENTFSILFENMRLVRYNSFGNNVRNRLRRRYLNGNLLTNWTSDIKQTIANADIVTMVKFVSAVACKDKTTKMIKRIFDTMKPGAMLFFLDNAGGGYYKKLMKNIAKDCHVKVIYGPLLHETYGSETFRINRFEFYSQSETKISFVVFLKPLRWYKFSSWYQWFNSEPNTDDPVTFVLKPQVRETHAEIAKGKTRVLIRCLRYIINSVCMRTTRKIFIIAILVLLIVFLTIFF